jgi:predicted dehydrogenase
MNWGVVGCAGIAIKSVIPAILSLNENKLIAVASRSITKARIIGEQFGCVGVGSYFLQGCILNG